MQNWVGGWIGGLDGTRTSLDEEVLIRKARRDCRWEDFGEDHFREPLRVLLDSVREEGFLTYTGRLVVHRTVLNGLCTRLRTQRAIHLHPEILEQPVKRPLIIVGGPRAGTTLLHHLLSQDPAGRALLGWEALRPAPVYRRQGQGPIPRRLLLQCAVGERILKRITPQVYRMHPLAYDRPEECHSLYWYSFVMPALMVLPSVRRWLKDPPEGAYDRAYADYRRALQLLEWQRPAPRHWVLKSPLHIWALDALMKAVPEASFIQTHRSLVDVIPSMCSLAAVLMNSVTDRLEPKKMGPLAMEFAHDAIERFTCARRTAGSERIMDIPYHELTADPIATARSIYRRFGYDYTPEFECRMEAYLADKKRSSPVKHDYALEQFSLDKDAITEEFAAYHEAFGIA